MNHHLAQPLLLVSTLLASTAATAVDLPRIFFTSVSGTGNLSTWGDAHGFSGMQAADEICRTRAAIAGIADASQYIAWLSDSSNDAYCRVHGLSGKLNGNQCTGGGQPSGLAGPWYRMDDQPAIDLAGNSMAAVFPNAGYMPRHILFDEYKHEVPAVPTEAGLAFTGSTENGVLVGSNDCAQWTGANASDQVSLGNAYRGYGWTSSFGWTCDKNLRLVCLKQGNGGAALPHRLPPTARMAFITSDTGSGNLSTWPTANASTGIDAGDSICQAHAQRANLPLSGSYKAWLSTAGIDAKDRFVNDGPWYRTDGVRVAGSMADLIDGVLDAPLQIDEAGRPMRFVSVWTGTFQDGQRGGFYCSDWTSNNGANANFGHSNAADAYWSHFQLGIVLGCGQMNVHLYCLADNDSLFLDGFDR